MALADELEKLQAKAAETVKAAKHSISIFEKVVKDGFKPIFKQVQSVIDTVQGFLKSTPRAIKDAFRPPLCCCCAVHAGEAKRKLEDALKGVADKVDTLRDFAEGTRASLPKLSELGDALDRLAEQLPPLLAPLRERAAE